MLKFSPFLWKQTVKYQQVAIEKDAELQSTSKIYFLTASQVPQSNKIYVGLLVILFSSLSLLLSFSLFIDIFSTNLLDFFSDGI
jgi:hypothetical protein